MIKAFISHSSVQKSFVEEMVEKLGRDFCILDCYDFRSSYKTLDEIYKKIEKSTVFVLLLSKDSITSKWVEEEIQYAKNKLQPNDLDRFWPYIIDKNLAIDDCPDWIKKDECFNLKLFLSPYMLARDIEQKFRNIIWAMNPKKKMIDTLMVGRNEDIDIFENIYQSSRGLRLKSLIISGRDGVGKDMFISQCMRKIGYDVEIEPYSINLGNKGGVEDFIIQLNLITRLLNEKELIELLHRDVSYKTDAAVKQFNKVLDSGSVLTIDDDMVCVQQDRRIADWILDILESSEIYNKLGLFIKSKKTPNTFVDTDHPVIGHINLNPLNTNDRMKLFYSLLRIYELTDIDENDVKWFVEKLLLSPSQIVKAVDALSSKPIGVVKKDINTLITWGDMQIKPFLSHFFADDEKKHILIIMSKMDIVSYEVLEKIYGERIIETMEIIHEMMDFGIVNAMGPNEQFFRLDHYFCDYIKRCRLNLPLDLESSFNEALEDVISSSNITEDVSVYLYENKRRIMSGRWNSDDFLIPSVVVTSIMDVYNKKSYDFVIKICDVALNDTHNYYEEQERELRYWLCLALARTKNERFFDEVSQLEYVDQYFLKGFFYRISMDYIKAERFLRKALELSPNMQRAKRELVTALLAQNKFDIAIPMAKENYERNPENSYQIQGYFRCLVRNRKNHHDDEVLKELMQGMHDNLSDRHEELYAAMNIEYQFFVKHLKPNEMFNLINDADEQFPNSISVKRAKQPFLIKQQIIKNEEVFPEES